MHAPSHTCNYHPRRCGSDGKTYGNECAARCTLPPGGSYTPGACGDGGGQSGTDGSGGSPVKCPSGEHTSPCFVDPCAVPPAGCPWAALSSAQCYSSTCLDGQLADGTKVRVALGCMKCMFTPLHGGILVCFSSTRSDLLFACAHRIVLTVRWCVCAAVFPFPPPQVGPCTAVYRLFDGSVKTCPQQPPSCGCTKEYRPV